VYLLGFVGGMCNFEPVLRCVLVRIYVGSTGYQK
jgi:hypothetical protein